MISSKKSAASIVAAKTARACDSCVKKRARWYCAADDAFLCQTCDSSVHSANPLARRHERVKLKTALSSSKNTMQSSCHKPSVPAWHRGFTRKPRTPRQVKSAAPQNKFPVVPEVGADDMSNEENEEEHVSYRVPIFDPFVAELTVANGESKTNNYSVGNGSSPSSCGFDLPSDIELADFAADMDSLLGRGLDDHECFGMLGLGLVDYDEKEASTTEEGSNASVKVEDVDEDSSLACQDETTEINLMREPFVFNFEDYDDDNSPGSCAENEEEEEENVKHGVRKTSSMENKSCKKRKTILRLDYNSPGSCAENEEEEEENVKHGVRKTSSMENKSCKKRKTILRLDYNSPGPCAENEEEEEENVKHGVRKTSSMENKSCKKGKTILRLDYDDVISKWDSKGTPFAFGDRPDVDSDCLPEFTGTSSEAELLNYPYGDSKGVIGLHSAMIDGGREARVSRYREKRRTRLFSKKIRYEVRKLNAEKRPRVKGRFVKRVSFGATGSTCPMLTA